MNKSRLPFLLVFVLCSCLLSPFARAEERVSIQNRLAVEITKIWAAAGEQAAVPISQRSLTHWQTISVAAEPLRGFDRVLAQPYSDSSFQFFLPFTLDKVTAMNFTNYGPPSGNRLAPKLLAIVGDERLAVPAGLPFRRLVALMVQGMTPDAVEKWLVALRLPGESPGRYAVALGDTTWGYREREAEFSEGRLAVLELSTSWMPKAVPDILADLRESGLGPVLLTVAGQSPQAFAEEGAALAPEAGRAALTPDEAWAEVAKRIENTMNASETPPAVTLILTGEGLRHTLSLMAGSDALGLRIERK